MICIKGDFHTTTELQDMGRIFISFTSFKLKGKSIVPFTAEVIMKFYWEKLFFGHW